MAPFLSSSPGGDGVPRPHTYPLDAFGVPVPAPSTLYQLH